MADVPRIPLGRPPAGSWLPGVTVAVAAFLVLAVFKPWEPRPAAVAPTPLPTFYVAPEATERTGPRPYDPRLFGAREPDPAWELWPAGYVVQFGMAGPLKVHGQDGESPAPGGTAAAASADPSAAPSIAEPTAPPLAPGVVDLGPSDHLVALGINMPLGAGIAEIDLRIDRGEHCCPDPIPIVHLPTLWESTHFVVIAPEDPSTPGQPGVWAVGQYALYLSTESGEVREVRFVVRPPLG